jgi:manganese/iron transport system ATP-binding protein/manganese/zinc/iron transport system ATP- binding protein
MTPRPVETRGLATGYGPGEPAVRDVTFAAQAGEVVALLGPNGGGKTTLLRALLGELPVLTGEVELRGPAAYVPQTEHARLDFPVTARDVALMGAFGRTPPWRRVSRADHRRADTSLARVGMGDGAGALFGELSRGQRQRALLARALVQDAPVMLLDEPFAGVDPASAERIEAVLEEERAAGRALLVSTHDVEQARRWDRVLCLARRQVAFGPPEQALTQPVLEETYGGELVVLRGGARAVAVGHHEH